MRAGCSPATYLLVEEVRYMGESRPLKFCNRVFNVVLAALLVGATLFAGYSL